MSRLLIGLIKIYQYIISPFIGTNCRFLPSCSNYTCEAIMKYGVIKGLVLGVGRVLRCHPWNPGGRDPVP